MIRPPRHIEAGGQAESLHAKAAARPRAKGRLLSVLRSARQCLPGLTNEQVPIRVNRGSAYPCCDARGAAHRRAVRLGFSSSASLGACGIPWAAGRIPVSSSGMRHGVSGLLSDGHGWTRASDLSGVRPTPAAAICNTRQPNPIARENTCHASPRTPSAAMLAARPQPSGGNLALAYATWSSR